MKMNKNNKKALSAGLAVAILVTGTFAWQSFNQYALNKTSGDALNEEPGGRLHDDFDGDNKDVYIENYASLEDGIDVYARIRLDEYFEYGQSADEEYLEVADRYTVGGVTVVRGDKENAKTPVREDESTWDTYLYGSVANGEEANSGDENIRTYRDLAFGGSTTYMPTFNKNIWDTKSEINGTYEGEDGDGLTNPDNRYSDYTEYFMGDESDLTQVILPTDYDNTVAGHEVDSDGEIVSHTAAKTQVATVMSYDSWVNEGSPVEDIWVYDTDGWAYYAKGISPQTASGLLLDNIQVMTDPDTNWFYAVNVVAQIAKAGAWDEAAFTDSETDIVTEPVSVRGLTILNKASGSTAVTNVGITKAGGLTLTNADLTVSVGTTLSLDAAVTVFEGTGAAYESEVIWTIESLTSSITGSQAMACFADGVFSPDSNLVGGRFTITATSKANVEKFDKITVTVE